MTDWARDFDEWVEGGTMPPDDQELAPIVGQEDADVWLRRLARLRTEGAQIAALAEAEMDRVVAWRTDRLAGVESAAARIEGLVERWARSMLTGKRKSLSLPWGTPSLRAAQASVLVTDDAAFEAWALAAGREDLLLGAKVRQPDKRAVAELAQGPEVEQPDPGVAHHAVVDAAGEVVPGVLLSVPSQDSFRIKPSAEPGE